MRCRLFIDEVGNDDVKSPSERFLSLTGITTKCDADERQITPEIERLKTELFGHDPLSNLVVLHRREIVRCEAPFEGLRDAQKNEEWERKILHLIENLPYIATTVFIDKLEHSNRYQKWLFNPYHYCLTNLVERFVLWLNRHDLVGDVVAEQRYKQLDKKLKSAFAYIYDHGTTNISASLVQRCLTSREIKLEPKSANCCGLQLVDMIGHPSHQAMKAEVLGSPMTARFGKKVVDILRRSRYARDPRTQRIKGWGQKWLP